MVKSQRNADLQLFLLIYIVSLVSIRIKNPFENKLNPRSRFQGICVKKGCFREQLKITTSVIALFVVANVSVDA